VLNGGAWYRDGGTNGATGMRFVSISGDVNDPGVFEVPFGQTVRDLIAMAGGMRDGQELQAIAPSGPSGGFLPAVLRQKDLPTAAAQAYFRDRLAPGRERWTSWTCRWTWRPSAASATCSARRSWPSATGRASSTSPATASNSTATSRAASASPAASARRSWSTC
jgi:hypothetical protein